MDDLNVAWTVIAIAAVILGPAGAMRMALRGVDARVTLVVKAINDRIEDFVRTSERERLETREWLKSLEEKSVQAASDIAVLKAKSGVD